MILFLDLLDTDDEKEKFEKLFNKYSNLLFQIAMKKVNNIEDAEDCVQETFLYVAKNFYKIGNIESKKTKNYLATVVSGYAINKYRRSKKIDYVPEEELDKIKYLEDISYLKVYESVELALLINKLDDEMKIYIFLKYVYGYTSKEIAEMYGIKDYYVRRKIIAAKNQLKKMYNKGEDDE